MRDYEHMNGLKEVLGSVGESIEIGEDNNYLRIHLHTNDYEDIRSLCSAFGGIVKFEVEDMREQNERIRKD